MKKFLIYSAVAMSMAAVAPVVDANASIVSVEIQESSKKVRISSFQGHMRISNYATVTNRGDYLEVEFGGDTYRAYSSNRAGYDWMFSTKTTDWYFNY